VHVTVDPFINVDALPPGTYRFKLEVVDSAGNVSAPVEHTLTVTAPPQPQPTPSPFPRTSPIGRTPIEPIERRTNIPIFKRPMEF
jgi:hypothetical protein